MPQDGLLTAEDILAHESYAKFVDGLLASAPKGWRGDKTMLAEAIARGEDMTPPGIYTRAVPVTAYPGADDYQAVMARNAIAGWEAMRYRNDPEFTPSERASFAAQGKQRQKQMQWDGLFAKGADELSLPFDTKAVKKHRVETRLAAVIGQHNTTLAKAAFGGPAWKYRKLRRSETNPSQLENYNPATDVWKQGPSLGEFLNERYEWGLFNDLQALLSRSEGKQHRPDAAIPATLDALANRQTVSADRFTPESLQIVISRDPVKIAEMSTGQRWHSCMEKNDSNYRYVEKDITEGTLVAYLTSKDDPLARYPLARQLLKPYVNEKGDTVLVPGRIYGNAGLEMRELLHLTLSRFVSEKVNAGKSGTFKMRDTLYGDNQAGVVHLKGGTQSSQHIEKTAIKNAFGRYLKNAIEELLSEIERAEARNKEPGDDKAKRHRHRLSNFRDPDKLARYFYQGLRSGGGFEDGILPTPQMLETVMRTPQMLERLWPYDRTILLFCDDSSKLIEYLTTHTMGYKREFNFRGSHLGMKEVQKIAEVLQANAPVYALDIARNRIGDKGVKAIAAALQHNTELRTLQLSDNGLTAAGSAHLLKAFASHTTLQRLVICHRDSGFGSVPNELSVGDIVGFCKKNTTLVKLGIDQFWSSDARRKIAAAIIAGGNPNLLEVDGFKGNPHTPELDAFLEENRRVATMFFEKLDAGGLSALTPEETRQVWERRTVIRVLCSGNYAQGESTAEEALDALAKQPPQTRVATAGSSLMRPRRTQDGGIV